MKENSNMRFLVVIETQKVKSYLFASPLMRETRGASVLLDLLNRKKTKEILQEFSASCEEVYLGGGSGRILFENKGEAERFKNEVLNLYRVQTINARVSVEIVERERLDREEPFLEWMRRGVRESQKNKMGRIEGVPVLAGRWIRPCTSCGSEPAEKTLFEHDQHLLCQACLVKREEVNKLYKATKLPKRGDRILGSVSHLQYEYTDNFIFTTLAKANEDAGFQVFLPQDFNEIGHVSKPSNYMGFIYADGNRMGEVVKKLGEMFPNDNDAKKAYRAFSEIVDQATREAAVEAVLNVVDLQEWVSEEGVMSRFIPAEFIMAGGDDLMLAVPSHNALDVATLFMEKFQEKTKMLQNQYELSELFAESGLTTSAGVIIAHTHYPISDLMTLAGELMKIAKEEAAKQEKGCETGTLDFLVLTESGSESAKHRRREYMKNSLSGLKIKLTERPYTTAGAQYLLKTIRDLKESNIPRTKLKALYSVLFQSPLQAQFDALRIKERLKATGDITENGSLHQLISYLNVFPFRKHKHDVNIWTTPLTEIVELYDFIQTEKHTREEVSTLNEVTL